MQRYRCNRCGNRFQQSRKTGRLATAITRQYVWNRQTAVQLAEHYNKSERWIRQQIEQTDVRTQHLEPRSVVLICDMTFWGRSYGVIVFRDPHNKKNLWWYESFQETPYIYAHGLDELDKQGWTIQGVVIDGKRGIATVFECAGIPVQYCQFHQIKTINKYLTRKPKLDAARALRYLTLSLTHTTEDQFRADLVLWYERYESFLNEKTVSPNTKRGWQYTHRRIRSAYRSLKTNCSRLFTYQRYPKLNIPNTTNSLDGMFSQVKNRLAVHRGLKRNRRFKIISQILSGGIK